MTRERIEAAVARIADATGRIEAAAGTPRPSRVKIAAALAELDALLDDLAQ